MVKEDIMLLNEQFFAKYFGKLPMNMNSIRVRKFTNEIRVEIFCTFENPKNCRKTEFGFCVDVFIPTREVRRGIKVNGSKALVGNPYYQELKSFVLRNMPKEADFKDKLLTFLPLIQNLNHWESFEFKGKKLKLALNDPDDQDFLEPIKGLRL